MIAKMVDQEQVNLRSAIMLDLEVLTQSVQNSVSTSIFCNHPPTAQGICQDCVS